jgi:large subunit ribosomal protein L18
MYKQVDRRRIRSFRKMRFWRRRLTQLSKPRLCVFRSARHIQAQVIDDATQRTLVSASSLEKSFKGTKVSGVELAKVVGKLAAERAKAAKISAVIFDRNGFNYHGRIKAFADSAREAGLEF